MSNHVHLIMDPGGDPKAISQAMKTLAGRHARRMNAKHEWKGSLWESRFHCSPIDTERYLLICGRYVDLNPVRASMVACPSEYPWSSFRARAGFAECDWLDDDPALVGLSSSPARRREIYRNFVASEAEASDLLLIRGALQRNQLTGDASFVDAIACKFGIAVSARGRGRPPQ